MGRRLDLGHLSEEECERILQVIQRDFDLRQLEKTRLGKIEEEIKEEETKTTILSKEPKFNENCCMRCFSRFMFIFNQKLQCKLCNYYICKDCSEYNKEDKHYTCKVCLKQNDLEKQSFDWFYSNVKRRFKRFGSAKVVRSLYKRRTDSDSENDSGYDPSLYSNSLPVGKRSRQSLQGLFPNLNPDPNAIQKARLGLPLGEEDEESAGSEKEVDSATYQAPFTCTTMPNNRSQPDQESLQEKEVQVFKERLNGIIDDIHRTLENQSPQGHPVGDKHTEYERMLDNHRLNISSALNKLSQRLHVAIDTENVGPSDDLPSPTTKHNIVKQRVIKEVEQYVGKPIDVGDEVTSEYASEDGSTSDIQNQKPYEDVLADSIVKMILDDHYRKDIERHLVEEVKVRNDLTRLSNKCRLEQLEDMMTESETDDIMSSARTSLLVETDADSQISETDNVSENLQITLCVPEHEKTKLSTTATSGNYSDLSTTVTPGNYSDDDDELDDLLLSNASEKDWAKLGRPKPQVIPSGGGHVIQHKLDLDKNKNVLREKKGESDLIIKDISQEILISKAMPIPQVAATKELVSPPSDSDDTLEAPSPSGSPVEDSPIRKFDAGGVMAIPDVSIEGAGFEFAKRHEVPLPSFSDDGNDLGREEIDLDDISRHSDDDDDEEREKPYYATQVSFDKNWSLGGPLFKDRSCVSAYDNFGERKVGKDIDGPVMMLIPGDGGQVPISPKIGDREVDDLSDLSENDEISTSGSESDEYDLEEEEGRQNHLHEIESLGIDQQILTNSYPTTMTQTSEAIALVAPPTKEEMERKRELKMKEESEEEEEEEVVDDNADPRFVDRPKSIAVPAGELARFECQVQGTEPIAVTWYYVFWYKDGTDIKQLDTDETHEVSIKDGRHFLEIFNTSSDHSGQYLCIAVNEVGRASRRFKLRLSEAATEKRAPEFLKELQDAEVMEGGVARFRCKVKGYPQPRVLWYKDGKRISGSSGLVYIEKIGNRDYLLTLDGVTINDDAEYSVVARNIAGEARSCAQLIVEPRVEGPPALDVEVPSLQLPPPSSVSVQSKVKKYPDTEELLKIAERVSLANSCVTGTAEEVLESADQLSSIHRQLDEMDRKLNHMEDEVHEAMSPQADSVISEDESTENMRDNILRQHQEMQAAAGNVRRVTSSALEVLTSAQKVIQKERNTTPNLPPQPDVLLIPRPSEEEENEDLNLTFQEFEILYDLGKITREQARTGRIPHQDVARLRQILEEEQAKREMAASNEPEIVDLDETALINCGPKRVNSKRYKRDYVINRSPQVTRKAEVRHWEVKTPSAEGTEIINSATAMDLDDTEEEIYMTASKVYSLEERIKQLESNIRDTNDDEALSDLEDQVARAVAQVKQSDRQVTKIEGRVNDLQADLKNMEPATLWNAQAYTDQQPQNILDVENNQSLQEDSFSESLSLNLDQSEFEEGITTDSITQNSPIRSTKGATAEKDIPATRSEFDGDFEMPSVKRLRSKFKESDDTTSVKRVSSLTGRDLPRTIREKLKKQNTGLTPNPNVRGPPIPPVNTTASAASSKPGLVGLFDDSELRIPDDPDQSCVKPSLLKLRTSTPVWGMSTSVETDQKLNVTSASGGRRSLSPVERETSTATLNVGVITPKEPIKQAKTVCVSNKPITEMSNQPFIARKLDEDEGVKTLIPAETTSTSITVTLAPPRQQDVTKETFNGPNVETENEAPAINMATYPAAQPIITQDSHTDKPEIMQSDIWSNSVVKIDNGPKEPITKQDTSNQAVKSTSFVTKTGIGLKQPVTAKDSNVLQPVKTQTTEHSGSGAAAPPVRPPRNTSKRGKSSAIMARAAFWDSRIEEGRYSDKQIEIEQEYPEMPEDSFKSAFDA